MSRFLSKVRGIAYPVLVTVTCQEHVVVDVVVVDVLQGSVPVGSVGLHR